MSWRMFSAVSSRISNARRKIAPIKISESASVRLAHLIRQHPDVDRVKGIRLGVTKKGCNGLTYTMNYIQTTESDCDKVKHDDVIVCGDDATHVFIDPNAVMTIVGTTMNYVDTELSSEFTFTNPNSRGSCGCGESFLI